MRKHIVLIVSILSFFAPFSSHALLSMELTRGVAGAIPIAVVPFAGGGDAPQDVSNIIAADLQHSGRFKVFAKQELSEFPASVKDVSTEYFRRLGTDNVVIGKVEVLGANQYRVNFELLKMFRGQEEDAVSLKKSFTVSAKDLRSVSHHISDMIYYYITGVKGIFSTRITYVVVDRSQERPRYVLELADQDGFNPRQILVSSEPIMSPSWSPDGKKIAYVSFEKRFASIYLHDIASGSRRLLSQFPGINGAPSWAPDGKKLALVLSKDGTPNIYVMDIATAHLRRITNDFYINTEPSWAPDGKSLIFTSNRSGGPQIYQVKLGSGEVSRVSYDGNYNARGSYTLDGKQIAMIHRADGLFKIALLDLDTGRTKILTGSAGDTASPSIAPNNSMILYDTFINGKNMLGMVSSDGGVQLVLPARDGQAQDPAWSPFLS